MEGGEDGGDELGTPGLNASCTALASTKFAASISLSRGSYRSLSGCGADHVPVSGVGLDGADITRRASL